MRSTTCTGEDQLGRAADQLAVLCRGLAPDQVSADDAIAITATLTRIVQLADGARVRLARRAVDVADAAEARDRVQQLADGSGRSLGEVKAEITLSADLPDRPHMDAALEAGALSSAQRKAIAGAVLADQGAEAELVGRAASGRSSLADLRRRSRQVIADADPDPEATRQRHHRRRSFKTWTEDDGEWHARVHGPADVGAQIEAAIKAASDRAFTDAQREGRREDATAYAFDGLVATLTAAAPTVPAPTPPAATPPAATPPAATAGTAVAPRDTSDARADADADAHSRADADAARDTSDAHADADAHAQADADEGGGAEPEHRRTRSRPPGASSRGRERKVIGIVDVAALNRGHAHTGETCHLAGVGPVSTQAIRDLLGEATAALLFRRGTTDLAVAHLGRQPTAFQRTALEARDYVCAVDGCGHARNLEIDHTLDWASTRRTRLSDLDWLCHRHHRQKSTGQMTLAGPPGRRHMVPRVRGPSP